MGFRTARLAVVPCLLVIASSGCGESSGGIGASSNGAGGSVSVGGGASNEATKGGGAGGPSGSDGMGGTVAASGSPNEAAGGQRELAGGGGAGRAGAAGGAANGAAGGGAGIVGAGLGGAGAVGGAGGAHAGGERCSLVHHIEVPFPFSTSPQPIVVKSGSEFGLFSASTLGSLSWSGELARQLFDNQACANSTCDGLFGKTVLRGDAGWRMLSADRTGQSASVRAWRMGDPSLPEARPLCGPDFSGLVSDFDFKPSRDGKRALFANGHRVVTPEVEFALVDAEGQMVMPAQTLELPYKLWNELTVVPNEHSATLSVLAESDDHAQRLWLLRELDSTGRIVFATQVSLPADYSCAYGGAGACAIVEDADAYYIWLASNNGPQRVARVLRARPDELTFDENVVAPGPLVGALSRTLVFRKDEYTATTIQTRFFGLPKEGAAEAQILFAAPALDRELYVVTQVIGTEGDSIFYSYQTATSQIVEEVACSPGP